MPPGTIASPPRKTACIRRGYTRGGLGLGHTARVHQPVAAMLPTGTVDVQGGVNFTVAWTAAGRLCAWGGNQYGQLGDGTTVMRWEPTTVKLPPRGKVTAIAVGRDHVVARTADKRPRPGAATTGASWAPARLRTSMSRPLSATAASGQSRPGTASPPLSPSAASS